MAQDKEKRVIAPHSFWETGTLFEGRNSLGKQISLRRLHQNTVVFLPYTHSLSNAEIVIVLQWEWEITCNWATRLWSVDAGWPFNPFPTGLVFGWELLWFPAVPEDKNVFCGECFYFQNSGHRMFSWKGISRVVYQPSPAERNFLKTMAS